MKNKVIGTLATGLWFLAASTQATVLVSDDFDSYTTGSLIGQGSGTGFTGNYVAGSGNTTPTVLVATGSYDLSYNISGGGTISSGANSVVLTGNANTAATQNIFSRSFSSDIDGQTLYMRFVMKNVQNITASTFLRFTLEDAVVAGSLGTPGLGLRNNAATNLWSGTAIATGATPTLGQTTLLVASYNWNSSLGRYDSLSLWQDPTYGASGTPLATAVIGAGESPSPTNPNFLSLSVGLANFQNFQTIAFDSFVVGTQWSDVMVAPVPEPSTWALVGAGLATLVFLHRKRNSRTPLSS